MNANNTHFFESCWNPIPEHYFEAKKIVNLHLSLNMTSVKPQSSIWYFAIIGHTIVALAVIDIFRRDYKKSDVDTEKRKSSRYYRSFHYLSIICYILIILVDIWLIIKYIPHICITAVKCALIFTISVRYTITIYQLCRLQYILSESQTHSSKHAYPNWLFIFLYIMGTTILIQAWISVWSFYEISYFKNEYCTATVTDFGKIWLLITFIVYYIWDLTILSLYVHKIWSFKKAKDVDKGVSKRINYVLSKIIILTILYEILSGLFALMIIDITGDDSLWLRFLREFGLMIEVLVNAAMMYLMIEHNDERYLQLLQILNKCKLCNCLLISEGDEEIQDSIDINEQKSIDTKTIHQVQMVHEQNENSLASNESQ